MIVSSGELAARVLSRLDDWKTPQQLSRETGLPVRDIRAILDSLARRGAVVRDGHLYLRRGGLR
jgi:DNA-binding IclR family transcriptional regulator